MKPTRGNLDASVETQLEEIERGLTDLVGKPGDNENSLAPYLREFTLRPYFGARPCAPWPAGRSPKWSGC